MKAFKGVQKGTVLSISAAALATSFAASASGRPLGPVAATVDQSRISVLRVATGGLGSSGPVDTCEEYISHTTHQFINQPPGTPVLIQAGFAEQEIAAAMYTLPASTFPIRIRSMEALFATVATVATTTKWSVLVWEGPPNLSQSIAEFNSDGVEIPHLQMPPAFGGAQGTVIQMIVDPQDPNQIIIDNAGGSNSFTIGFRIDDHHNQSGNPCLTPPAATANAFPVTFVDGQQTLTGNWLRAINCGVLGCPPNGGWTSFQGLAPGQCRPSGDWVLRALWEPANCNSGCYPDCTGESKLTVADFGCFQTRFVLQEPYADCTEDSAFNIADFACFQTKFVQGCP